MSVTNYDELIKHKGHKIECVTYGYEDDKGVYYPTNVALECVDCYEVLLDFDIEYEDEKGE